MRRFKRRLKFFVKDNLKVVVAFIIGIIMSSTGVYAATIYFDGVNVGYDNTTSGLSSTDVQAAIDEINTTVDTWMDTSNMGTPQYYAFGKYKGWCSSTDTYCNSYANFPTTSTPPTGRRVYATKYTDDQYGVCIKRNDGTSYCFKSRNYVAESKHIYKAFSGENVTCDDRTSVVDCFDVDFSCTFYSTGDVSCIDRVAKVFCSVSGDGYVACNNI